MKKDYIEPKCKVVKLDIAANALLQIASTPTEEVPAGEGMGEPDD